MLRAPVRFLGLIVVALAAVCMVCWFALDRPFGMAQLQDGADRAFRRMLAAVGDIPSPHREVGIFLAALVLGWMSAAWWIGRHLRQRPLVIADLRRADMPLSEGVRHVRINAFPPVTDDAAAVSLLLGEAARGRLTLWRRQRPDILGRVSPLAVRAAIAQMRLLSSVEQWRVTHGGAFVLLAAEVDRLWPVHRGNPRRDGVPRIIVAAGAAEN